MNFQKTTLFFISAVLFLVVGCDTFSTPNESTATSGNNVSDSRILSSEYASLRLVQVATGFDHPWSLAFLPDGSMLVTERPGHLYVVDNGIKTEIKGLPEITARGQGGLLEVSVHPEYAANGWIYFTYSKPDGSGQTATALARAQIEDDALVELETIFVQNRYSDPGRHYGSKLAWTLDGTLLMSIGDRGSDPPRAQDLMDHAGTLIRLNDDGTVPSDNPFVGDPNALDEIYSYGHRNIQGLVVHPETGDIWATEHGPRGGDELNLVQAGENYGWPIVTLGLDYRSQDEFPHARARRMEGMVDPVYEFLPTLAPSGLALVKGHHFSERWDDNLLAGGLRAQRIRRVVIHQEEVIHEEELLLHEIGRIRDVRIGPDQHIYVLNDRTNGSIYRIEPN